MLQSSARHPATCRSTHHSGLALGEVVAEHAEHDVTARHQQRLVRRHDAVVHLETHVCAEKNDAALRMYLLSHSWTTCVPQVMLEKTTDKVSTPALLTRRA